MSTFLAHWCGRNALTMARALAASRGKCLQHRGQSGSGALEPLPSVYHDGTPARRQTARSRGSLPQ